MVGAVGLQGGRVLEDGMRVKLLRRSVTEHNQLPHWDSFRGMNGDALGIDGSLDVLA